nr:hypothetical protein L204_05966 [Cryptococcus depauperatus CBS 7855]
MVAANSSDGSSSKKFFSLPSKGQVLQALTLTQNTSAMMFTVFLIPHLASPLAASVAGIRGADQTMVEYILDFRHGRLLIHIQMIARDLYLPLEPVIVYIPLAIHLTSSLARRAILASSKSLPNSLRLPSQIHQFLAYPLLLLLIPHMITHRLIPADPAPPIRQLSPSEIGWEYVGYNLRKWSAWGVYLGLVGTSIWHAIVGGMKIATWMKSRHWSKPSAAMVEKKSLPKRRGIPKKRKIGLNGFVVVLLGVVSIGLWRVAREIGPVSPLMKIRYDGVFQATPWAKLYNKLS